MKHKLLLIIATLLLLANTVSAQNYKWVKGGGSTDNIMNGGIQHEPLKAICTDDNKNVYILAQVGDHNIKADTFSQNALNPGSGNALWHIMFASYDCNGNMRFSKLIESKGNNVAYGLEYKAGKIYLCGTLYNTGKRFGYDATFTTISQSSFLAKYDTSGIYEWAKFVGPENNATLFGTGRNAALAIDGSGNIHHYCYLWAGVQINSSITSQTGNYDIKYDASGNLLGATLLQFPDTNYRIYQARVNPSNGITYALLSKNGTGPGLWQFLIAYTSTGSPLWTDSLLGSSYISKINLSPNAIYFAGGANGRDSFRVGGMKTKNTHHATGAFSVLGKLDLNGNALWLRRIDGRTGVHSITGGEILPNGDIAGFGHYNGTSWYGNDSIVSATGGTIFPYIIVVDSIGNTVKLEHVNTGSDGLASATAVDKTGSLYLGGYISSTITPTGITGYTSKGGNSDFFLMKYGINCNCTALPVSGFTFTTPSATSKTVQFTFNGTTPSDSVVWDFGDGTAKANQNNPSHTYTNGGNFNVCATVYTQCGSRKFCKSVQVTVGITGIDMLQGISVYPNPVTDVLHIEGVAGNVKYRLLNTIGAVVQHGSLEYNGNVNTSQLSSGIYMLEIISEGKRAALRVTKH